ncbi:MAG: hypothetical protein SynsKO_45810 [Synoicihabitans sp.]
MSRAVQLQLTIELVLAGGGKVPGGARTGAKKVIPFAHQKYGYVVKRLNAAAQSCAMGKEKSQRGRKFGEGIRRVGALGHHRLKYKTHTA